MKADNSHSSLSVRNFLPTNPDKAAFELPDMVAVRQLFSGDRIVDLDRAVRDQLSRFSHMRLQGKRIAITAGSRGIDGMVDVLGSIAAQLREWGAAPFLIPAMGSHGGATADGQLAVLKSLGITESSIGAPIRASMDVVEVGQIREGTRVCCDRLAFESDGIVVCNRIKAHSGFQGDFESGLVKMMVIGLGKHVGTNSIHRLGFDQFHRVIPEAAALNLARSPILFGVGVIENAYGKPVIVEAMSAGNIFDREKELLKTAKALMGKIPVENIDLLIVDELGKEISGGGMDSNVTGRSASGLKRVDAPVIKRIVVRDLTPDTMGNGIGIGLADITTQRAAEKINLADMYTNALTAGTTLAAKIPIIAATDRDAIVLACRSGNGFSTNGLRIVQIRNTKDLERVWLSRAYLPEMIDREDLVVDGDPQAFDFDRVGNMLWPTRR